MILSFNSRHLAIKYEDDEEMDITWEDVYSVSYYKIDCIEYEIGYLVFDFVWGEYIEITDNVEEWETILSDLERYLPSQTKDWRKTLVNWTIVDGILIIYETN